MTASTFIPSLKPVQEEYRADAGLFYVISKRSPSDIGTLKSQPFRMSVILRTLAQVEPYVRGNKNLINKPVRKFIDNPKIGEEIDDILSQNQIRLPSFYVSKGAAAIVCRNRDRIIRLATNEEIPRVESRYVLKAQETIEMGNTGLRYENLRIADTDNVPTYAVYKLRNALPLEGNYFWDANSDNVGVVDNKVRVIDAGAVWTQSDLLQHSHPRHIEEYKSIRRQRGLPELIK